MGSRSNIPISNNNSEVQDDIESESDDSSEGELIENDGENASNQEDSEEENNEEMGGGDLNEAHRSRISSKIQSHKWSHSLFFTVLDISIVNAWINWNDTSTKKNISLHDFQKNIIEQINIPVFWWKKKKKKF